MKTKIVYSVLFVLMILVSACAQKPAQEAAASVPKVQAPPETQPKPEVKPISMPTETVPSAESVPPVPETKVVETPTAAATEIKILGKAGFEPAQLDVSAGTKVTWLNNDQKTLTLNIFKEGKFYKNSPLIQPGGKFEHEFTEKGAYEYWAVAYGAKAKLTVK